MTSDTQATPRTDKHLSRRSKGKQFPADSCDPEFCRQLERELAVTKEHEEYLNKQWDEAIISNIEKAARLKVVQDQLAAALFRAEKLAEAKRPWSPEHTKSVIDGQVKEIDRLTALVQSERSRAERAERDARRYRFLRDFLGPEDFYSKCPRWTVAVESGGMGQVLRGDKLDAAIDAALPAAPEEGRS